MKCQSFQYFVTKKYNQAQAAENAHDAPI